MFFCFFFFFQAEDGIRDHCVTGVQTCALPIYTGRLGAHAELGPEPHGALGETSVEPGTIENPTDIALGDLHLRVVGCDEHDAPDLPGHPGDRKSTRLNSSHTVISYAVFCLKKKKENHCG